jgi:SAM-dependent methyltransferase
MIDRELNYGRDVIACLLRKAKPYASVLDIGAGSGHDLMTARTIEPQSALYAIECSGLNVNRLRSAGICTYRENIEREVIPLPAESIDVIIANQTFEHLKEVFWVLHEVSRVLKVGGHLLIGVPNLASLHNRLLLAAGLQPTSIKNNSAHVRGYTRSDFVKLMCCIPLGINSSRGEGVIVIHCHVRWHSPVQGSSHLWRGHYLCFLGNAAHTLGSSWTSLSWQSLRRISSWELRANSPVKNLINRIWL